MAQAAEKLKLMTVDEFLDWDGGGHQGKLELIDGVVRAMAPASYAHGLIQANLTVIIGSHLKSRKSQCRVGTEVGVFPPLNARYNCRVPDVSVSCLPVGNGKRGPDPVLVIEVLSPGNADETWESMRACANILAVQEVLAVESEAVAARYFRRADNGGWPIDGIVLGAADTVSLVSIDLTFPLLDAYAGTPLA